MKHTTMARFLISLLVIACTAVSAAAEDTVVRFPRRSGVEMPSGVQAKAFSIDPEEPELESSSDDPILPALPRCEGQSARRTEVFTFSPAASFFEALYYDPNDRAQSAYAQRYSGRVVPYVSGQPLSRLHPMLSFASTLKLRCLPTLFHYPMEQGHRFEEYLEGDDAWKTVPKTSPSLPSQAPAAPQTRKPAPSTENRF